MVSDFDTFTVGCRGIRHEPTPPDQVELIHWALDHTAELLKQDNTKGWTGHWLDVLKVTLSLSPSLSLTLALTLTLILTLTLTLTLRCTSPRDVLLLLKSSDRVAHDLCDARRFCDPGAP